MKRFFIISLFFIVSLALNAQNIPKPMNPPRLVNDFAGILTGEGVQALEDSLVLFSKTTSTQIAVVTVKDLDGYAPSEYALAILRGWGVGVKDKNNGIVLLIKPRNEYGRGEIYIAVGGGLEGVLNDAKAGRVIDNYMIEDLSNGDYLQAVVKGTYILRGIVRGEFTADVIDDTEDEDVKSVIIIFLIIFAIIVIIIIKADKKNGGNFTKGGGRGTIIPPIIRFGPSGGGRSSFGGGFGGFGGGRGFGGGAGRSF